MSDIHDRRLNELLASRDGWRQESDPAAGAMWCFGVDGESRLVLSVVAGRYVLYSANTDDDVELSSIEDLRRWVELLEPSHAGLSETGKRYAAALLTIETEKWLQEPHQEP